jgi:hypothetical protein
VGRIIGIAAVMAVLAAIAPGQFGGSGSEKKEGPLRWQAPARTSELVGGTGGHLLFGRVVNHSDRTLRLRASDLHVLDRDGHRLATRAAFADGFVPGVTLSGYGAEMYGADDGGSVGRQIVLRTGQAAPITASFTAGDDQRAATIDYGSGRLKLR